jgi:hypothetical protein
MCLTLSDAFRIPTNGRTSKGFWAAVKGSRGVCQEDDGDQTQGNRPAEEMNGRAG